MTNASQLLLTFLANALWQVAVIAIVASGCSWLLRSAAARYRHLLWVAAFSAAVIVPIASSIDFAPAEVATTVDTYESLVTEPVPYHFTPSEPGRLSLAGAVHLSVGGTIAVVLLGLYLITLIYRVAKLLKAWRYARTMARVSSPVALPDEVAAIADDYRKTLGIGQFRLHQLSSVQAPMTVGVFHPIVIFPEDSFTNPDTAMVKSAVGHELVHILRRDYLWNLLYEVVSIPLSFHPAAALIKRYIARTRELRCDEIVTERLVDPETYARALLRLANAAIPSRYPASTLTVGITDADILEERVMKMLNKNRINAWHAGFLIVLASLLLAIPCAAAAPFAFRINVRQESPAIPYVAQQQQETKERRELERQARELKERLEQQAKEQEQQAKEQEHQARELQERAKAEVELTSQQEKERAQKLEAEARQKMELYAFTGNTAELEERRRLERQIRAKYQAELAREAKVSMDQAIQLALNQQAGKVVECVLQKEMNEVMYRLIIVNDADPGIRHYVFLSGMDGRIVKTETEK